MTKRACYGLVLISLGLKSMLLVLAKARERVFGCKCIRFRQKVMKEVWFNNKNTVQKKGEREARKI